MKFYSINVLLILSGVLATARMRTVPKRADASLLGASQRFDAVYSSHHDHTASVTPGTWPTLNINPIDFGADPTGVSDSTAALAAAIRAAANVSTTPRPSVVAAGGVVVDLVGGTYLVSSPLQMNSSFFDGIVIRGGTLVASASFPVDGFLLEFRYTQQVLLEDLILDNQHRGGGMRFETTFQLTVQNVFYLHYSTWGVLGDDASGQGHELTIQNSYFAEYMFGEPGYNETTAKNGTAIEMRFPDSNFLNNIIRCTKVGVWDRSSANAWLGLHIYASCHPEPDGTNLNVAFISDGMQPRINACYFDDSPVVVRTLEQMRISDSIFLGLAALILAPQSANVAASGVVISRNMFSATRYASPYVAVDTSAGSVNVSAMVHVDVYENTFSDASMERSTRPSATVTLSGVANASVAQPACASLNLTSSLVFGVPTNAPHSWMRHLPPYDTAREAALLALGGARRSVASAPRVSPAIARWSGAATLLSTTGFTSDAVLMPLVSVSPVSGDAASVNVCVWLPTATLYVPGGATATWSAAAFVSVDQSAPVVTL